MYNLLYRSQQTYTQLTVLNCFIAVVCAVRLDFRQQNTTRVAPPCVTAFLFLRTNFRSHHPVTVKNSNITRSTLKHGVQSSRFKQKLARRIINGENIGRWICRWQRMNERTNEWMASTARRTHVDGQEVARACATTIDNGIPRALARTRASQRMKTTGSHTHTHYGDTQPARNCRKTARGLRTANKEYTGV